MSEAQIDITGKEGGQGELASYFQGSGRLEVGQMRPFIANDGKPYVTVHTGGDPKRANNYKTIQVNSGTLRRDEWRQLDEAVLGIAENRLNGVQDLIDRGLTFDLGNAMGTTVLEYHDVGDALEAELSMDAVTRGEGGRQEFNSVYLPIPIIHVDYEINQRVLESSRRLGNPLDTLNAERASRKLSEKLENMLFADESYKFGNGTIHSYLNFPQRNQDVTIDTAWNDDSVSGEDIVEDVLDMKQASLDNFHYGPWYLYVPPQWETKLDEDYSDQKGTNTIRERLLNIGGIEEVKVIDTMPDNNVLLVQMTTDVVRLVRGMGVQNIQWQTEGGFVHKFKAITIQVPQLRADQNNRSGIIHATT